MVKTEATSKGFPGFDAVAEDIIPKIDNTFNLGSLSKKWAMIFVVIAMVTSITVGGVVKISTLDTTLLINDSTQIQGDLTVDDNLTVVKNLSVGNILFVDSKVGIGTTSLFGALTIDGGDSFIINNNGFVVGHTSQIDFGAIPEFQILGTGAPDSSMGFARFSANAGGATLRFLKSRSGTIGTNTLVLDGDELGRIRFQAADGTDFNTNAAEISAEVDGSPGSNDIPGRILFSTTSDGSSSVIERMRLTSQGRLGINTTTPQNTLNVLGDLNVTGDSYFNNFTLGSILFIGANSILKEDNANFFWDDTNNKLLINKGIDVTSEGLATIINLKSFGGNTQLRGLTAGGTEASPTATGANTILFSMTAIGFDVNGFTLPSGLFSFETEEAWAFGKHGTKFVIDTTKAGTADRTEKFRILGSGEVGIGTKFPQNTLNVFGDGNFTGNLIVGTSASPQNITMYSPDGTSFSCGVLNSGTFACS